MYAFKSVRPEVGVTKTTRVDAPPHVPARVCMELRHETPRMHAGDLVHYHAEIVKDIARALRGVEPVLPASCVVSVELRVTYEPGEP